MATDPKKKAQTKAKNQAKRQVKKVAKKNPGIVIAIVAIVVVIVVVAAVLYLKVPAVHDAITNIISPESSTGQNGANNSGNNGNQEQQGGNQQGGNQQGGNQQGGNQQGEGGTPLVIGEGDLKVHFIDVGQGDCIYIQFPDGKDMLIDCGNVSGSSGSSAFKTSTINYLAEINDDDIDYLMLTHGDQDHVSYLDEIIEAYQIYNIYMPNILAVPNNSTLQEKVNALPGEKLALFNPNNHLGTAVYANFFIAALSEENCQIVLNVDADDEHNSIVISDGSTYELKFYCMTSTQWDNLKLNDDSSGEPKNQISPVGILEYNGKRIVFTGDSNELNEPYMVDRIGYIDCDVLKVAHHGSATSSIPEFLDAVTCEYAVFSCYARGNTYYHPRQETIDRLLERNYKAIYRTDLNGNIILTIDKNGELSLVPDTESTPELIHNGFSEQELTILKNYKSQKENGEITKSQYDALVEQWFTDSLGY